jgi:hypothetical protein
MTPYHEPQTGANVRASPQSIRHGIDAPDFNQPGRNSVRPRDFAE